MLESLIITVREGIEGALVVAIIVAFLRKEGRADALRWVWAGLGAAVLASFAGGVVLRQWAIDEELFEGVLYLVSAAMVASMLLWMWRHARRLSGEIRSSLSRIVEKGSGGAIAWGIFLFTFLMVFREGVETVLFLAAVSLTTSGLMAALGALLGLLLAVVFGVLFARGSLRIDLSRFLRVTAVALLVFVVQLLVNGYHELAEGGYVPATRGTMAVIGPLVRHDVFFLIAILALPLIALALPAKTAAGAAAAAANPAEQRLLLAEARRARRTRLAACAAGIVVLSLLGMDVAYSQPAAISPAVQLAPDATGHVSLAAGELADGELHRYAVRVQGREVRFIALEIAPGKAVAAFDACVICGAEGYVQQGAEILCRHCRSAIYPPSIGQPGGCNPIPVEFHLEGSRLVLSVTALATQAGLFGEDGGSHH
ncbi:MAG TPA: Fe-S-containing protein [Thermoanaerobaculia bacterium]|jgi:FTR1 family protein|nr:Fe-S-containing protein [Thermoanaerobaculia bacterium]